MKKTIITTVGTSLFKNYNEEEKDQNIASQVKALEKVRYSDSKWKEKESRVNKIRGKVSNWANANNKASAEIESSLKIIEEIKKVNAEEEEIEIILLATDTVLSRLAAEIVQKVFKENNVTVIFNSDKDVISGLQLEDKDEFEKEGLMQLVERVSGICGIYTTDNNKTNTKAEVKKEVYLNITGGYKALIPYLTIMGQIYKLPICYKFEKSDNILTIPQAPVEYDFLLVEENYLLFERLNKGKDENLPNVKEFKELISENEGIFKNVIEELEKNGLIRKLPPEEGEIKLTPMGKMLFARYNRFAEQGIDRGNLLGRVMEMEVYQYYVEKYMLNNNDKNQVILGEKVLNSKNPDAASFDVDVFIKLLNGKRIAIEVKPGGNIPVFGKSNENNIESNIKKRAFYELSKKETDIECRVYCYSHREIVKAAIKQIKKLHDEYPKETKNLSWYWVKIGVKNENGNRTMDFGKKIKPEKIYPTN